MSEQFAYKGPVKTQYALNLTVVFILTQDSDNGIHLLVIENYRIAQASGHFRVGFVVLALYASSLKYNDPVLHG